MSARVQASQRPKLSGPPTMAANRTKKEMEEALASAEAENRRQREDHALLEAENRRLRTEMQLLYIEELACKANLSSRPVMPHQSSRPVMPHLSSRPVMPHQSSRPVMPHLSSRPVVHLGCHAVSLSSSLPVKLQFIAFRSDADKGKGPFAPPAAAVPEQGGGAERAPGEAH